MSPPVARDLHPDRFKADLVLLCACIGWGSTFAIVKGALDDASSNVFLAVRFTIGALVAALVARRSLTDLPALKAGALLGLFLWVGFELNMWGLAHTSATHAGFITSLNVVLVAPIGFLAFHQRIHVSAWVGTLLAGIGLVVLAAPTLMRGGSILGDVVTVLSAVAYAFHMLFTSRYAGHVKAAPTVTAQLAVVAVFSALATPFETVRFNLTPALAGALAFTGICASALFLFMQLWAQARTSAVRAALVFSLEPLFAAIFARFLLGDPLLPEVWEGGALILCGILLAALPSSPEWANLR